MPPVYQMAQTSWRPAGLDEIGLPTVGVVIGVLLMPGLMVFLLASHVTLMAASAAISLVPSPASRSSSMAQYPR